MFSGPTEHRFIGRSLGKVRILSILGKGGMGIVYKGRHEMLQKLVAVKVLPHSPFLPEGARERFLREARLAAQLDHLHIVQVYDVEQALDFDYIVMQFVEGCSLQDILKNKGPLSLEDGLLVLRQALAGLQFAHSKGIIHRDIKPANLLINPEGSLKIADFGLSRQTLGESLTASGLIMGTPEYMPPEQAYGEEVDPRGDIYSLGVTIYTLLAGKVPFSGDTPLNIVMQKLDQSLPLLHEIRSEIPEPLSQLIVKMALPQRSVRFASCQEVLDSLNQLDSLPLSNHSDSLATMTIELKPLSKDIPESKGSFPSISSLDSSVENLPEKKDLPPSKKFSTLTKILALFVVFWGWMLFVKGPKDREYHRLFREAQKAYKNGHLTQAKLVARFAKELKNTSEVRTFLEEVEGIKDLHQYYLQQAKKFLKAKKFPRALEFVQKSLKQKNTPAGTRLLANIQLQLDREPLPLEDINSAKILSLGEKDHSSIPSKSSQFYQMTPGKIFQFTLNLSSSMNNIPGEEKLDLDMEVFDSKGKRIAKAFAPRPREQITLSGGRVYYVKISNLSSADGSYSLVGKASQGSQDDQITGFTYLGKTQSPKGLLLKRYRHDLTGMIFVKLPGGKVKIGRDKEPYWDTDNHPCISVTLAPFLISQTEVTQGCWKKIMKSQPWVRKWGGKFVRAGDQYPAVYVDWLMALKFCEKTGLALPSESQWEYACRGGTHTRFFWEDNPNQAQYGWLGKNLTSGERFAHEVGKKAPNPFGLYDMAGNVWEWCADIWHPNYKGLPRDGTPYAKGEPLLYVVRGGSWLSDLSYASSFNRSWQDWSSVSCDKGFRCVYRLKK